MAKIFISPTPANVDVWFESEPATAGYSVDSLRVKVGTLSGALVLAQGFLLDARLVAGRTHATDVDKRLLSWDEAVQGEAKALAAAAMNALHETLQRLSVRHDGATVKGVVADFLGIRGIAEASTDFHLWINPGNLLDGIGADEAIFRATAQAAFKGGFSSPFVPAAVDAHVRIEVELTRAGALELLSSVEVPELPQFSLALPRTVLPKWSFDGLSLPDLDMEFFRLPLQSELDVVVTWTPKPALDFAIVNGKLKLKTSPSNVAVAIGTVEVLRANAVALGVEGSSIQLAASNIVAKADSRTIPQIDLSQRLGGPFLVVLSDVSVKVAAAGTGPVTLTVTLDIGRILIRARTDPALRLAAALTIELTYVNGKLTPTLKKFDLLEPYPIRLALVAAHVIEDGARRLLSFLKRLEIPDVDAPGTPDLPSLASFLGVLRRIGELAAAAAAWLATQGAAAARALAGLAEAAFKLIAGAVAALADAIASAGKAVAKAVVVEVRVDLNRWRVVQIVVTPAEPDVASPAFKRAFLGIELDVPYAFTPALVCDLEQGWFALALQTAAIGKPVTLSTDLWLAQEKSGVVEPVSGTAKGGTPQNETRTPLLQLKATPKQQFAIALVMVDNGKAAFFRKLTTSTIAAPIVNASGQTVVPVGHLLLAARIGRIGAFDEGDFKIEPEMDEGRVLSMFRTPGDAALTDDWSKQFSQHIKVKGFDKTQVKVDTLRVEIPLDIEIKFSDTTVDTRLAIKIDLVTLSTKIEGGRFGIELGKNEFSLLGLSGKFVPTNEATSPFKPLFLDFSDGDPRLGLNDEQARIELFFDKLSSGGRGLGFSVDQFIVSRDGVDLSAAVKNEPVTLAGVDMPFRFDKGQLSVKRSEIQSFALAGHGNLPPALVGEAKASIELSFAQRDGALALQAAQAVLDKSADPLRCEGTQFSISLTKLGLKFVEQGGYHFYFTLTGSAEFRPSGDSFASGLLKNLSSLRIVLDEAPLASDPRVLLNHIEFQVTVEPPSRTNFFDLFGFELRGVGFHPAAKEFGGSPAFSISGQVNFTDFGDVVTPRFDFHKLWIAPPESGKVLPRVRFDGLGVGLSLGSMGEASGTAIAVDGSLPSLFKPDSLPANVTAKGFLASGSLRIQGWASMSASMGFLQLEKKGIDEKRQAFFLYVQRNDMSEKIPTPIGTIFLREVGFGFGYRYTLAGIAAADRVETPRELVKVLDEVSKYQGSLDDVKAWLPTFDNSALTLALRGLFSLTSASSSSEYNEEGEKELPNLVLFDIVAALRTDLTFLMNLRAFVAYNYADWREAQKTKAAWRSDPTLTGYLYLSVPRREFLARAVYNPGAEVGNHPKLPDELKTAMKAVRWSSTLYIRPGLFHMEFGWPYELGFALGKPSDSFYLSVEGGTVLRFEDAAILYGLAFRARGHIRFAYDTGGSFGAAVSARAELALGAKLIAYLSAKISESMFYGVITLDVTIEFSVRMWLKTKWFSLSAGFSRSITIHVGVELLIEPNGLAARIEASVAVGAFGRTLSVGIGFTLGNNNRLASARARVERFLSLGLASSYPNPEAGVAVSRPAPLPEPSRAANALSADTRVEQDAQRREATARPDTYPAPGEDLFEIVGTDFGDTIPYWGLLFPIAAEGTREEHYLVQLIPRDTSAGVEETGKPSHFYAAPIDNEASETPYLVTGVQKKEILYRTGLEPEDDSAGGFKIKSDWGAPFGLQGDGNNALPPPRLGVAFRGACFMAPGKPRNDELEATDIESLPWAEAEYLPDDPAAANIRLAAAARSRADAGPTFKRMQQVEEARSCFIATVADCAEQLAGMITFGQNDEISVRPQAAQLEFDPRAIGLTFVLSRTRLAELFPTMDSNDGNPPESSEFTVATRIPVKGKPFLTKAAAVRLFNPPDRMFRRASPMLRDVVPEQTVSGIQLRWDLEPAWSTSKTIYDDPEFHLKHYRIERRIEKLGPKAAGVQPAPRQFTVKAADHLEVTLDGGVLKKRRLRSRLQFVDDLQDVHPTVRDALLKPVLSSEAGRITTDVLTGDSCIVYAVVARDCAGTCGTGDELRLPVNPPVVEQKAALKALARFRYDSVPKLAASFATPDDFLAFTIEEEEALAEPADREIDDDARPELGQARNYTLRIRQEHIVAVGVFGADALSTARAEPPVPDRWQLTPLENETDIVLGKPGKPADDAKKRKITIRRVPRRLRMRTTPGKLPEPRDEVVKYTLSEADFKKLVTALDISTSADIGASARVQAARLYLRPEPDGSDALPPQWCPVQLQLQIGAGDEPAVDTTIERFEHPLDVQFRPIRARSIKTSSGRLHLYHPTPKATFRDFVEEPEETVQLLCDADQRSGVMLGWNARPSDTAPVGKSDVTATESKALHSLIAGYDLFALDTTAIPANPDDPTRWRSPLRLVTPLGRVQRLPAQERGLEPAETGDFARVESFYPSDTQRLIDTKLDRRYRKRRAVWYSPAESLLLWPRRPLRRSVLALPDETDIARLFARQCPVSIRIEWVAAEKDGKPWPVGGGVMPGFGLAVEAGGPEATLVDGILQKKVSASGDRAFTVDEVRSLLRRIVVKGDTLDGNDAAANTHPGLFGNLALALTPRDKNDKDVRSEDGLPASVTIGVSLAPGLHPVLADTLDLLQYDAESVPAYRRYEAVLETPPPLNADRLSAFLDETAADRDPAGWGVLRTLGLAAAFRLYDIEDARFLESGKALELLQPALARALPRYADARRACGAPFVDVLFTADRLAELVSHHGTAPRDPDAARVLRTSKALALVQIELRPTVEALAPRVDSKKLVAVTRNVHYATLTRSTGDAFILQPVRPKGDGKTPAPILIEVDALVPTDGGAQRRVLLMQGAAGDRFPFVSGETISDAIRFAAGPDKSDIAYVRFVALAGGISESDLSGLLQTTTENGVVISPVEVTFSTQPTEGPAGPWGRFGDLPDTWLAALLFKDGIVKSPDGEAQQNPPFGTGAPHDTLATLMNVLGSRAAKQGNTAFGEIPRQAKQRLELAGRLSAWTRRFMEHGPAFPVSPDTTGLAFGMLTRPNPWRVAPDADGQLSVLLLEKDRWGKTRKYAVRPFGRYENLVQAQAAQEAKNKKLPGTVLAPPSFAESFPRKEIDSATKVANVLYHYFADAVIERTESLAAPVIIATRRNDRADASGLRRPGETVQIIVSRHPEEVLSDANIRVDAGIAMRHVAVGFWREFAAPQWAAMVRHQAKLVAPIDLLAGFGPFSAQQHNYELLPVPKALSIVKKPGSTTAAAHVPADARPLDDIDIRSIRELYERHPDLWRGAYALEFAAMPYGFRLHATAHAAAGVIVSPSSVATVDEAGYRLVLPWKAVVTKPVGWQDLAVTPPRWRIKRPEPEAIDEPVRLIVHWPLVRLVDGMFEDARAIWFQDDAPSLYRLPDPAVSYRLSIETLDGRVRVGEVDVGAVTGDPEKPENPQAKVPERHALYLNQLIGSRFTQPIQICLHAQLPTHFELELTLKVKGEGDDPLPRDPLADFAPAPLDTLPLPDDLRVAATEMAVWGEIAPRLAGSVRTLEATVSPPDVKDPVMGPPDPLWTAFKKAVDAFVTAMETYAALAGPVAVKDAAADIVKKIKPYAVDRVADWKGTVTGGKAQPVKLALPWVLGFPADAAAAVQVANSKGWDWPVDPPATATDAPARAAVAALLDEAIKQANGKPERQARLEQLKRTIIDAMRARTVARRRYSDEQPVHLLRPLRERNLPSGIDLAKLPDIAATDPIDLLATVLLPAQAGRTEADVEKAITALEGTINTADALESLRVLAREPQASAEILLRWSAKAAVIPELKALSSVALLDPAITTLIVLKPAMRSEAKTFEPASARLLEIAERLSQEMLFGPRRQLVIQAFHGLARPADSVVEKDDSK